MDQFALVELTEAHDLHEYACLSHCWGSNVQPIKLNEENQQRLKDGLPRSELPQTFREAAEIRDWVGIRYLWIDSLCIFQDSDDDWLREAAQMPNIYRNALLTVGAACAVDSTSGLFSARDKFITTVPYCIQESDGRSKKSSELRAIVDPWLWEEEVELSVWNSRAWVLQVTIWSTSDRCNTNKCRSVFYLREFSTVEEINCFGSVEKDWPARRFRKAYLNSISRATE
jgi:hypothetical protein